VKNNNLTNGLFAALLLSSPLVGADSKYPAADFQPTVVYQDSELMQKIPVQPLRLAKRLHPLQLAKLILNTQRLTLNHKWFTVMQTTNHKKTCLSTNQKQQNHLPPLK